jgi:hypothetical protein
VAMAEGFVPPQEMEGWASFSYRTLGGDSSWRPVKTRKTIEMLDFFSFFVGDNNYLTPYKKTNPVVIQLAKLYAPIARSRVQHFFYQFPLEIKLAKGLGLFAKTS